MREISAWGKEKKIEGNSEGGGGGENEIRRWGARNTRRRRRKREKNDQLVHRIRAKECDNE